MFRVEEVDAVEVRDVHSPCVGSLTVRAILLDVEPKEADLTAVYLFKDKHGLRAVGKLLRKVLYGR